MTQDTTKATPILVDRRFILTASAAAAGACALSPALSAYAHGATKGMEPTGQTAILDLDGNNAVDVSALSEGEMVVVAAAGTFYGILRRNGDQIAAAAADAADRDPQADADRVQVAEYLVVDMACPHKGCQVGYTGEADEAFSCPCHRSKFDASGRVLGGASRTNLGVPPYAISGTVVTFT